jgi:hypothetical protein
MSDANNGRGQSRDSGPLQLGQLSNDELRTIIEIERRLREAQDTEFKGEFGDDILKCYLARPQKRSPRVLLLDGGRGTGKTSLLLSLVERWHRHSHGGEKLPNEQYGKRIDQLYKWPKFDKGESGHDRGLLENVKVVGILDFDPLPPEMPLIAGIVQAWRPLVEKYDALRFTEEDCDDNAERLIDRWHRLFQMAAVSWSPVPRNTNGLIDQLLDREDQVQDWHRLADSWQVFVSRILKVGKGLAGEDQLAEKTVFVVMIDDVDLQVARIRELLPTLRMLYHPRVAFIVAADRQHLRHMLELEFAGQQNAVENRHWKRDPSESRDGEQWASELARASFEKVFARRNQWTVQPLTLRDVLNFPDGHERELSKNGSGGETIQQQLDQWCQQPKPLKWYGSAGTYLKEMTPDDTDPVYPFHLVSFRTAHQIFERVTVGSNGSARSKALRILREIIDPIQTHEIPSSALGIDTAQANPSTEPAGSAGVERSTEGTPQPNQGDTDKICKRPEGQQARGANGCAASVPASTEEPTTAIEYLGRGSLDAVFGLEVVEPWTRTADVVVSARPAFQYTRIPTGETVVSGSQWLERDSEINRVLLAISLREDEYYVSAPGMQWNIRLALAWTRVRVTVKTPMTQVLNLAFTWKMQVHPSPLRLLQWTRKWREFVRTQPDNAPDRIERIAYAWIYYQVRWLDEGYEEKLKGRRLPIAKGPLEQTDFQSLVGVTDNLAHTRQDGTPVEDAASWRRQTLPLLARPEVGLHPDIQTVLLARVESADRQWLHDERLRLITDAIVDGSRHRAASQPLEDPTKYDVGAISDELEAMYCAAWRKELGESGLSRSPWFEKVESEPETAPEPEAAPTA